MKIGVSSVETNATTSDLALVTAIRSGDQGAMAALYDRFSSIVYAVALRVLQDTGAAEDVLQDIFMQLAQSWSFRCEPRQHGFVAGGDRAASGH